MAHCPLFACIVTASLVAGCTSMPVGRGPLVPHGHLEVSADRSIVTVHLDFYNEGNIPLEFPRYPTGEAATAFLDPFVANTGNSGRRVEGVFLDGPTGVGPGASVIFNGSDVIPPQSWWNTTFHLKYEPPLREPWVLVYSASLEYREQNGTGYWHWSYTLPCYNVDGTLNTTFAPKLCGKFQVFNWTASRHSTK